MYKFLLKNSTAVAFGLGIVVAGIALLMILSGLSSYDALLEEERGQTSIFNAGLMGAIFLIVVAAVLMLGFGLVQIISNPKGGLKFILGLVVIFLIGFLFYQFSTVETSGKVYQQIQEGNLGEGTSKVLNGALWLVIILIGAALLGLIASEIRNLFK
jgi:membrane protease YdiL (CAAX protease family)